MRGRRLDISPEARTTLRYLLHDLRTPLGQILGYSEMLEEEVRERGLEDLASDLDRIREAARGMLGYLDEAFQADAPVEVAPPPSESAVPTGATAAARAVGLEADPDAARLLVVDDDPADRELLARRLTKRGYAVSMASGGREALHAIESGGFDLVLLDVLMEGLGGLEVLDAIRRSRSASELPVVMATALGSSEDVVEALRRGANDYVAKPFDVEVVCARIEAQLALLRSVRDVAALAQELELRNAFIRRTFGRYLSDEIVAELLEAPSGLEIGGEKRRLSILMADLRGFSGITETLAPSRVLALLNLYLDAMSEVIQAHGGTIDEYQGDAVLAFFGAPVAHGDDVDRAVAAALSMQRALEEVNRRNQRASLPSVEMGIGIATGEVIVGNVGSTRRSKYGAVGPPINLAARIESFSLGGEVLVDEATRLALADRLEIDSSRQVQPKGIEGSVPIHRVRAIGGAHAVSLPGYEEVWIPLAEAVGVRLALVEGKAVASVQERGALCELSAHEARLAAPAPWPELSSLRVECLDAAGVPLPGAVYAKVVGKDRLRWTSRAPWLDALLARGPTENS